MNTKIKYFALLTVCLFFMAIFTSACGGGKNNPPTNDNSAYYYLLAQQNANNNQQEENNNQEEQNNNEQQEENNPVEEEVTEVTLNDEVLQKLGYQKEEKGIEENVYYIIKKIDTTKSRILEENEVTSVEIPATFTYENKTYKITKIGNKAFYMCRNLTRVTIPDTVTEIEDGINNKNFYGAFMGSGITSIELPNSITKIGDFAFFECYQLTSVNIPEKVTTIGEAAFYCCKNENLSITLPDSPDSVTTIGESAFYCVQNIYYNDRDELTTQEGYPYWGACKSNGTYNPNY